jgi:propionyl-CoA synthetase
VPVIDHWWQTETAWAIAGNPLGIGERLPVKYGSTSKCRCRAGTCRSWTTTASRGTGKKGNIGHEAADAPGAFTTLWNSRRALPRMPITRRIPGYLHHRRFRLH